MCIFQRTSINTVHEMRTKIMTEKSISNITNSFSDKRILSILLDKIFSLMNEDSEFSIQLTKKFATYGYTPQEYKLLEECNKKCFSKQQINYLYEYINRRQKKSEPILQNVQYDEIQTRMAQYIQRKYTNRKNSVTGELIDPNVITERGLIKHKSEHAHGDHAH